MSNLPDQLASPPKASWQYPVHQVNVPTASPTLLALPTSTDTLNKTKADANKKSVLNMTILETLDPIPTLTLLPAKDIADLSACAWSNNTWFHTETSFHARPPFLEHFYLNVLASKALQAQIHVHTVLLSDPFAIDWARVINDSDLDAFIDKGFLVIDDVFAERDLLALQLESGFVDYRDALLTDGLRQPDIRGDRIRWIMPDFLAGANYLRCIHDLGQFFNRTLYTGIRRSEAHYACYPKGFGYQWHYDNPTGRDERVISAVFYLNDDWTPQDGGALAVVDKQKETHKLLPKANRLVFFDSNLYHQVEIAHRQRYSIATWLRRDDLVNLAGTFG